MSLGARLWEPPTAVEFARKMIFPTRTRFVELDKALQSIKGWMAEPPKRRVVKRSMVRHGHPAVRGRSRTPNRDGDDGDVHGAVAGSHSPDAQNRKEIATTSAPASCPRGFCRWNRARRSAFG